MAFFVVQRDADSGLSIPLPDSYPTREAAIAALSSATASGALTLTGEVFIADLGTAVPVLLMAVPSGPAPEEAPAAELTADEANQEGALAPEAIEVAPDPELSEAGSEPEEPGTLDVEAADEVYAPASFLGDEESLAAALKRAASSLEGEGIVAPASIASAPEEADETQALEPEAAQAAGAEWPWANVEAYTQEAEPESGDDEPEAAPETAAADTPEDAGSEDESLPVSVDEEDVTSLDGVPSIEELPTESAQSFEQADEPIVASPSDEDEESPYLEAPAADVIEPLSIAGITDDESAEAAGPVAEEIVLPEEQPIITSAPAAGEEAYVPRPVILGDYADVVAPGGSEGVEDMSVLGLVPDPDPVMPAMAEATVEAEPEIAPALEPMVGYEATGDVNFEEYTCQDCVYANTCPKVGEATPANCGSFQWRAE